MTIYKLKEENETANLITILKLSYLLAYKASISLINFSILKIDNCKYFFSITNGGAQEIIEYNF